MLRRTKRKKNFTCYGWRCFFRGDGLPRSGEEFVEKLQAEIVFPAKKTYVYVSDDTPITSFLSNIRVVEKDKDKIWDYMGAIYPMGYLSPEKNLLFDRDKIDKVISEGYSDENEKIFRLELERNLVTMKRK